MPCEGLLAKNGSQAIEQPVEALHEVLPDIGTSKLRTALSLMREIAMVGRTRRGAVKLQARIADQHADGHLREAAQRYTAMAENDREILDRMIGYAQSAHCRWRVVLDYFAAQLGSVGTSWAAASSQYGHGDAGASISDELDGGVCDTCDNCVAPPTITPGPREMREAQKYATCAVDRAKDKDLASGRRSTGAPLRRRRGEARKR
jgi:ATP-dependent DNA helicase RecQ